MHADAFRRSAQHANVATRDPGGAGPWHGAPARIQEIVIVDPDGKFYESLRASARVGAIGIHVCVDGQAALRLARRFRADAWLVNVDLPDIGGFDLVATPNTPITIGVVPEPSAIALTGIGALALGAGAIRRSRKARTESLATAV